MGYGELFLIAVGLSMDAFAVAVSKGLNMTRINYRHAIIISLFFGVFQAFMPLIGWFLGQRFESYIAQFDHWIASVLLIFIGAKMAVECFKKGHDDDQEINIFDLKELFTLSVATSIDALAVGIGFAFLKVNIISSICIIGIITFILSFIGVGIGHRFGAKFKNKAALAGGIILILIGIKIPLEHLGLIHF